MNGWIGEALGRHGIDRFGVCRFGDCLPLLECRAKRRIPENARSVIACLFPYHIGEFPSRNLSRYAVVADYHTVAGAILEELCVEHNRRFPGERCAAFVDNSPIREVHAAALAGLGVVGRNGQLIDPVYGSWVFIGTVVTTLELPPSQPKTAPCLQCGACLRACPTGALQEDGFDQGLCRSHITQKKGTLTPWEGEQVTLGGLAWGCDLCQECCPMNSGKQISPIAAFSKDPQPVLTGENLDRLLQDKPYGYRGKAVLLRNLALINQNRNRS